MLLLLGRSTARRALLPVLALALLGLGGTASASSMNYGDFVGANVMYLDVTESSATDPVPLFGPPALEGANGLDFDPMHFAAFASGGFDITDGQLNFGLMATEGSGITSLSFLEAGDYTLLGLGDDAAARVSAALAVRIKILEVDGIALPTPISVAVNASTGDDLASGEDVLSPWSLALFVDLAAALGQNQLGFELGVTKAEVVLDNQLLALASADAVAAIFKKEFVIRPDGNFRQAPEPAALGLLGLALGLGLARRARRSVH